MKKKIIFIVVAIIILIGSFTGYIYYQKEQIRKKEELENQTVEQIKSHYSKFVVVTKDTSLYEDDKEVGLLKKGILLKLSEQKILTSNDQKFLLKNIPYSVSYQDVKPVKEFQLQNEYPNYKKYIPWNQTMTVKKLYLNEETFYEMPEVECQIIIKKDGKYYTEYDEKLLYAKEEEILEIKDTSEQTLEKAESVPVLNYHYVIAIDGVEDKECTQAICHSEAQFESHMKYIRDNDFFTLTMQELEMFLNDEIIIPKKSVVVTMDDGWYISRAIPILERYQTQATLFLIGSLLPSNTYQSPYLEVHSHGWDIHRANVCPGGRGAAIKCMDHESLLEDLKKSRESLNGSTVFCFPFYEYNEYAVNTLKEAGFTMAFIGQDRSVSKSDNRLLLPRYRINNRTTVEQLANILNQ